jgi:hypothetical protein
MHVAFVDEFKYLGTTISNNMSYRGTKTTSHPPPKCAYNAGGGYVAQHDVAQEPPRRSQRQRTRASEEPSGHIRVTQEARGKRAPRSERENVRKSMLKLLIAMSTRRRSELIPQSTRTPKRIALSRVTALPQ